MKFILLTMLFFMTGCSAPTVEVDPEIPVVEEVEIDKNETNAETEKESGIKDETESSESVEGDAEDEHESKDEVKQELPNENNASAEKDETSQPKNREDITAGVEDRFFEWIEYLEEPDQLTKELTEFITLTTFIQKPNANFATTKEADASMILANTIFFTKQVPVANFSNSEYIDVDGFNCSNVILREHVEENAKTWYGEDIELALDGYRSVDYNADEKVYCIFGSGLRYHNPVILNIKEMGHIYDVTVVLPETGGYEETPYRYEGMSQDTPSVTLEEAIEKSVKRSMLIEKTDEGHYRLLRHKILK